MSQLSCFDCRVVSSCDSVMGREVSGFALEALSVAPPQHHRTDQLILSVLLHHSCTDALSLLRPPARIVAVPFIFSMLRASSCLGCKQSRHRNPHNLHRTLYRTSSEPPIEPST